MRFCVLVLTTYCCSEISKLLLIGLAFLFLGAVLGFRIILLLRLTVLLTLLRVFVSAFYHKKSGASNIMFTVLEVWSIGLTLGFLFVRTLKPVTIEIFFIARNDTPFLSPGVGMLGPIELDG